MAPSNRLLRLSQAAVPHVIVPVLAHASPSPERARQYNRQKRRVTLLASGIGWLGSTAAVFTGISGRIHQRVRRRGALNATASESITIVILSLLGSLAALPFRYYSGYALEHRFQLSTQTRRAWVWEEAKALAVGLAFEVPGAQLILAIIRRRPRTWWAIVSALTLPLTVVLAQLGPVLIAPLFNRYEPLRDRQLGDRLRRLASRSGITVTDVLEMDMSRQTAKANAFFAGIGRTRRIVLADTLLANFSPDEIEVIVAHEMGHQAHRDTWRLIGVGTLATFASTFIVDRVAKATLRRSGRRIGSDDLGSVAALSVLAWSASLVAALLTPLQNAYSRVIERRADRYALELTGNPQAFVSAMQRLATQNLDDPAPPAIVRLLLYTHPPIAERVDEARRFAAGHGVALPRDVVR